MSAKVKDSAKSGADDVTFWLAQTDASAKREEKWLKRAKDIVNLYEGEEKDKCPFNILFSNTDTLMPALYSSTPRTQTTRRFKDSDPTGAAACSALNRVIDYHLDTNEEEYSEFDELANQAILEALVPGRGIVRWKYDANVQEADADDSKAEEGNPAERENNVPEEGSNIQKPAPVGIVSDEKVCGEYVPYNRFLMGYAKKWKDVPWIAFLHDMTEEEAEDNFGAEIAAKMVFTLQEDSEGGVSKKTSEKDNRKLARVFEIWDKQKKQVTFVSASYKDAVLKQVPDPLSLNGFYPMDEPLMFQRKISTMVPTAPYDIYEEQAEELNITTRRIKAMIGMCKVRGFYDETLEGMEKVLQSDDGILTPLGQVGQLNPGEKLESRLWLMPLSEIVAVLQQLLLHRTNIKQVIYEITGISDILRGSSVASETATAQNIKNQWGTLRLKKMQKVVQKWARNNLRIIGEIAGRKFSVETFQKITGLPFVTQAAQQQATQQAQALAQQGQQAMMQAQQTGQPPPKPPPQVVQQIQALQQTLTQPVWEVVIGLLRRQEDRSFRVDIETNSTIADDMAEDQQHIGELLNALSQFLNGVTPLIQSGSMPFEVAKSMMLIIVRKMEAGPDMEKLLEEMKAPPPPAPEPAPPAPPVDPNIQLKAQAEQAKIQADMKKSAQDQEYAAQDHAIRMEEAKQKMRLNAHTHELKMEAANQKAAQIKATAAVRPTSGGN